MLLLFYYFLITNIFGFIQIAYDKKQAIKEKRRISERRLLGVILLGGIIGSGLSMLIFRHKTAKSSYLLKYFGILLLQLLILYWLYKQ
ncbi:DUF1294 domain-containing protein [Flavobacterium flavipallidum]|uniref:DUF1294 domain-containing protein n=1 Tax=Flavobacterium flavipallidum TaxID=3139140 RepID=A0ABU9HQE3_9FLAO